jgi:hypothetical protein
VVAGEIGDDRHVEGFDNFEDYDRTATGTLQFKDSRGDVELASDEFTDAPRSTIAKKPRIL